MGNSLTLLSSERIGELAQELCEKARENSLDSSIDSPFALLAKDNDIMWSGGKSFDVVTTFLRGFVSAVTHCEILRNAGRLHRHRGTCSGKVG
jgi:hypothetical protein